MIHNDIFLSLLECSTLRSLDFPRPDYNIAVFSILAPDIPRDAEKHQSGGNEERSKRGRERE